MPLPAKKAINFNHGAFEFFFNAPQKLCFGFFEGGGLAAFLLVRQR
jgi:hypothetical protein